MAGADALSSPAQRGRGDRLKGGGGGGAPACLGANQRLRRAIMDENDGVVRTAAIPQSYFHSSYKN